MYRERNGERERSRHTERERDTDRQAGKETDGVGERPAASQAD
jgi:hypothetical protein